MAFRHIIINNPANLSFKNNQLLVRQEAQEVKVPLEDINAIVLENERSLLSSRLISECMQRNIAFYFCDGKHMPNGITLPFQSHNQQSLRLLDQINLKKPFIKRIWQKVIQAKIINQAEVLRINKANGYERVLNLADKVSSGDTNNVEGYAASYYFRYLFGSDFTRDMLRGENAALDYGYSIMRSEIARVLVAYGFAPSLGIKHKNQFNNFNLADDFIEPFRPIVDLYVKQYVTRTTQLTPQLKQSLVKLVTNDVLINKRKESVSNAVDIMIKSYVSAMKKDNIEKLLLPQILPLNIHRYE